MSPSLIRLRRSCNVAQVVCAMINHPALSWMARAEWERECETRINGESAFWLREFHRSHFFFSRIAPGMNNSEDLAPESTYNLPRPRSPRPPRCGGRDATFHIPQSLRIFVSRCLRSFLRPVVRSATRTASSQAISSLTRILCILKCTRDTLFELWPFVRSGIRCAFLSWITWRHRFCVWLWPASANSSRLHVGSDARVEIYSSIMILLIIAFNGMKWLVFWKELIINVIVLCSNLFN